MKSFSVIVLSVIVAVGFSSFAEEAKREDLKLEKWSSGFAFYPENNEKMKMFYWFHEHFILKAVYNKNWKPAGKGGPLEISDDGKTAKTKKRKDGMQLSVVSKDGALDMLLTVTNQSKYEWPEVAAIIPCLSPSLIRRKSKDEPKTIMNGKGENFDPTTFETPNMVNNNTFVVIDDKLQQLKLRELHYCDSYREKIDTELNGKVLKKNWPVNEANFSKGVMIRESTDGVYVVAVAWEDAISVQGHNPYCCMHLSIRVGGLKPGESKTVRGKMYLFKGKKEDSMKLLDKDFEYWKANPVK